MKRSSTRAADVFETIESGHSRQETRCVYSLEAPEWLRNKEPWRDLNSLIMVEATRELNDQVSAERRYYIASPAPDAEQAAEVIHGHWGIENSAHLDS